jgi:alkylation response protein AidB-like acyl-CoA dehydrogenase
MSEPNAGSDLASLSTRADRDGDRFIVNGQKVWTSYSMVAAKCFCYVRTTPLGEAPKHQGITVLIIDMDTAGIDVRPIKHITGAEDFAEVFFTDVEVPVSNVVGAIDDGWRITMGSLAHERGGLWLQSVAMVQQTVDDLCAMARRHGLDGDAGVRRRLAEAYEQVASLRALGYKGFSSFAQGSSSPEHSIPFETTPIFSVRSIRRSPGRTAPGSATGTRWPAAMFVAPQTISRGSPSPVVTRVSDSRSARGWRSTDSSSPTTTFRQSTPQRSMPLTSIPSSVRRSARASGLRSTST